MWPVFKNDGKRAFGTPLFWLLTAGISCLYFFSYNRENERILSLLLFDSVSNNDLAVFSVLGSTLPFSGAFCVDWHSGNFQLQIVRSGKCKYAVSKMTTAILSGGIFMMISRLFILFMGILSGYSVVEQNWVANGQIFWRDYFLADGHVTAYFVSILICCFLTGAVWAAFGMCLSAYISSPFVAYFMPYVGMLLEKLFSVLLKDIPDIIWIGNAWKGLNMANGLINGMMLNLLVPVVYLVLFSLLFIGGIGKRKL